MNNRTSFQRGDLVTTNVMGATVYGRVLQTFDGLSMVQAAWYQTPARTGVAYEYAYAFYTVHPDTSR